MSAITSDPIHTIIPKDTGKTSGADTICGSLFRPAASREGCGSYLTVSYGTTAPAQLEASGERALDAATLAAVFAEG